MKIKINDKVKILSGKDSGKTGKVLQVFADKNRISVEGINLMIKNQRPKKQGEKGQRIQFPASLNMSNVALVCPKCDKPTRVGYKVIEPKVDDKDGKKSKDRRIKNRICKKCKEVI